MGVKKKRLSVVKCFDKNLRRIDQWIDTGNELASAAKQPKKEEGILWFVSGAYRNVGITEDQAVSCSSSCREQARHPPAECFVITAVVCRETTTKMVVSVRIAFRACKSTYKLGYLSKFLSNNGRNCAVTVPQSRFISTSRVSYNTPSKYKPVIGANGFLIFL